MWKEFVAEMINIERRQAIMVILQSQKSATVEELAQQLYVSPATIRRDLAQLEKDGSIQRGHGGAILRDSRDVEPPLLMREAENRLAKESIAVLAATLIRDHSILFLDSSTTVMRLIPHLRRFNRLTVITHGLKTALALYDFKQITVYCTGGRLAENTLSMHGPGACERISQFNADYCFVSCRGFSLEYGVTDASEDEAQVKRSMMQASRTKVLLFDSSKMNERYLIRCCNFNDFDAIATDKALPREAKETLENSGVFVLSPGETAP